MLSPVLARRVVSLGVWLCTQVFADQVRSHPDGDGAGVEPRVRVVRRDAARGHDGQVCAEGGDAEHRLEEGGRECTRVEELDYAHALAMQRPHLVG
eukprot:248814-Pleurochrysis_carterae.AAC.1